MSFWDDSGYHLSDPKHPDNANAGKGLGTSHAAKRILAKRLLLVDGQGNARYADPEADALKDQGGQA